MRVCDCGPVAKAREACGHGRGDAGARLEVLQDTPFPHMILRHRRVIQVHPILAQVVVCAGMAASHVGGVAASKRLSRTVSQTLGVILDFLLESSMALMACGVGCKHAVVACARLIILLKMQSQRSYMRVCIP